MEVERIAPLHTHSLILRYDVKFRREDTSMEEFNWTDRRKQAFRILYAKAAMWVSHLHTTCDVYFSKYINFGKVNPGEDKFVIQSGLTFNEDNSVTIQLDYKLYQRDFTSLEVFQISEDLRCALLSLTTEGCEPHMRPRFHMVDDFTELFHFGEGGIIWFDPVSNLDTAFAKATIPCASNS